MDLRGSILQPNIGAGQVKRKDASKYNLHVRLTPPIARELKKLALDEGMTITMFIRMILSQAIRGK